MKRIIRWVGSIISVAGVVVFCEGETKGAVTLTSSLSVSQRYNDNLFFREKGREADFTTMISPGLTITYDSRSVVLSIRYRGTAEFHARHPDANRYGQAASFNLDLPFLSHKIKGLDIQITETVSFKPDLLAFPLGDRAQEANEGIQVGRNDTFRNHAGVAVRYAWSPRFRSTLSYLNILTRFRRADLQDSVVHDAGLEGWHQVSLRTRWIASYGISMTDYETAEKTVAHRFTLGAVHQISPLFSINGNLGLAHLSGGPSRLALSAGLSRRLRSGNLSLEYNQRFGTGGGVTPTATLSQRIVGEATREIGQNTSVSLQFAYGRNISLSGPDLKIASYEAGTGITTAFLPWLRGSLSYSYLNQQIDGEAGEDGQRNMVTLTLTATAPEWKVNW